MSLDGHGCVAERIDELCMAVAVETDGHGCGFGQARSYQRNSYADGISPVS